MSFDWDEDEEWLGEPFEPIKSKRKPRTRKKRSGNYTGGIGRRRNKKPLSEQSNAGSTENSSTTLRPICQSERIENEVDGSH